MKFLHARVMQLTVVFLFSWFMGGVALAQQMCQALIPGGTQVQTIFAGQTIEAGTVTLEVLGEDLVVSYNTIDEWELTEAHLWVGSSLDDLPRARNGNPKIGRFPYNSGELPNVTEYSFVVPLAELDFSCPSDDTNFFAAAHAVVERPDGSGGTQSETGWAEGDRIVPRGSWATFFEFTLACACGDDTGGDDGGDMFCETAFAFGETELDDIPDLENGGTITQRFGWQLGPIAVGELRQTDLLAGAGNNNVEVAEHTGSVTVDYFQSGSSCFVDVFYDTTTAESNLGNWFLTETHVFADTVPTQTAAPGLLGNTHDDLNGVQFDSYILELPFDSRAGCQPAFVVAHATVCYIPGDDDDGGIIIEPSDSETAPGNGRGNGRGRGR